MKILTGNILRLECPACQQPMEMGIDEARRGVVCPACAEFFAPALPAAAPVAAVPTSGQKSIRNTADNFRAFALLSGLAGLCVLGASVIALINDSHFIGGWIWAGSLISTSLWLYLIAQVIHIRANTHR